MPSEWKDRPLNDLYDFSSGLSKPRSEFGSGYPFLTFKDVFYNIFVPHQLGDLVNSTEAERVSRSIRRGDVFLTRTSETMDELGMSCVALKDHESATFNGFTKRLRPKEGVEIVPEYAGYFFRSPRFRAEVTAMSSLSTRASLNNEMLGRLRMALPDVSTQWAIGGILKAFDDKIELNRRLNETLETMARALFKSWFVDFDPVRAKAEGRETGLPKHIADLFPDSFEESELGEIPKGWEVRTVEEVAKRVGMGPFGSSIRVATFVATGTPIISGQHLHGFMMEDKDFNFISAEHAERLRNAIVERGDVIFTHAGNIGQVAYIPENSQYTRYVMSQRQFFMRCDRARVAPVFMALYFKSENGQQQLLANASSSGVPSIARPVTYLRSIKLVLPASPVMVAFEQLLQAALVKFRCSLNENGILAALRDALLPKLISGELRVKDAERFAAEAAV